MDLNSWLIILLTGIYTITQVKDYMLNKKKYNKSEDELCNEHSTEIKRIFDRLNDLESDSGKQESEDKEIKKLVMKHDNTIGIIQKDITYIKESQIKSEEHQEEIFKRLNDAEKNLSSINTKLEYISIEQKTE